MKPIFAFILVLNSFVAAADSGFLSDWEVLLTKSDPVYSIYYHQFITDFAEAKTKTGSWLPTISVNPKYSFSRTNYGTEMKSQSASSNFSINQNLPWGGNVYFKMSNQFDFILGEPWDFLYHSSFEGNLSIPLFSPLLVSTSDSIRKWFSNLGTFERQALLNWELARQKRVTETLGIYLEFMINKFHLELSEDMLNVAKIKVDTSTILRNAGSYSIMDENKFRMEYLQANTDLWDVKKRNLELDAELRSFADVSQIKPAPLDDLLTSLEKDIEKFEQVPYRPDLALSKETQISSKFKLIEKELKDSPAIIVGAQASPIFDDANIKKKFSPQEAAVEAWQNLKDFSWTITAEVYIPLTPWDQLYSSREQNMNAEISFSMQEQQKVNEERTLMRVWPLLTKNAKLGVEKSYELLQQEELRFQENMAEYNSGKLTQLEIDEQSLLVKKARLEYFKSRSARIILLYKGQL